MGDKFGDCHMTTWYCTGNNLSSIASQSAIQKQYWQSALQMMQSSIVHGDLGTLFETKYQKLQNCYTEIEHLIVPVSHSPNVHESE